MKKLLGGAGAALGIKILTGFAVAAAAATFAVAATEVAITGSVNPTNWGQQVRQQVADCKASAARLSEHGVGQCVSQFANQHGDAVSDSHPKDAHGDKTGNGNGNSSGHDSNNGNGNAKNKSHGHGDPEPNNPPVAPAHGKIIPKQ